MDTILIDKKRASILSSPWRDDDVTCTIDSIQVYTGDLDIEYITKGIIQMQFPFENQHAKYQEMLRRVIEQISGNRKADIQRRIDRFVEDQFHELTTLLKQRIKIRAPGRRLLNVVIARHEIIVVSEEINNLDEERY